MKSLTDVRTLQNGVKMPCIGFGTWKTPDESAKNAVIEALRAGYRHIDTATSYGNEAAVGDGIAASEISRADVFLTTKLWNPHQGYQSTIEACEDSLKKLRMDYLDLYLIHWPHDKKYFDNWQERNLETWHAFEALYKSGKVRAIGVSNFRPHHVDNILTQCSVVPMVDQVEFHPGMPQTEVLDYCKAHDMVVEGWSPLGSGRIFDSAPMQEIAARYGKSVAQVCVRFALQHEVVPLPKSVTPSRIAQNANVFDFCLSPEDMDTIVKIDCGWSGLDPDNLDY